MVEQKYKLFIDISHFIFCSEIELLKIEYAAIEPFELIQTLQESKFFSSFVHQKPRINEMINQKKSGFASDRI